MSKVVIAAGGTGGHVFPALAVAQELQAKGWQVEWIGTTHRIESRVVPAAGFSFTGVEQQALRGRSKLSLWIAPFRLLKQVVKMRTFLKQQKPQLVLGFGGYTAGPVGVAAWTLKVPLVIHEQNAVPGLTNRWLAKIAQQVFLGFKAAQGVLKKGQWVGNPVRQELIEKARQLPGEQERLNDLTHLLVVGGSLGAAHLNEVVPAALPADFKGVVLHQTGADQVEQTQLAYQSKGVRNVQVVPFIEDMASAYQRADLVICRSGALTCSELACFGKASILVPYPYAVDDHQYENAKVLEAVEGALILKQDDCSVEALNNALKGLLLEPKLLKLMGQKARTVAVLDAAEQIVAACEPYQN